MKKHFDTEVETVYFLLIFIYYKSTLGQLWKGQSIERANQQDFAWLQKACQLQYYMYLECSRFDLCMYCPQYT